MHQSNVIFARFDNSSHANETAELSGCGGGSGGGSERDDGSSVLEVDLHFGTDQSIENVNRAFNNPMFDANIDRGMLDGMNDDNDGNDNDSKNGIDEAKL